MAEALCRSAKLDLGDEIQVVEATPVLGESTAEAVLMGRQWLESSTTDEARDEMNRPPITPTYVVLPEGALQPSPGQDRRRSRRGT